MKHIFIVNPLAGKGRDPDVFHRQVEEAFLAEGLEYIFFVTAKENEAITIAQTMAQDYPEESLRFYACGGDGTANEVLQGIYGRDNCQLAIVPHGSGNDFLKNFENSHLFSNLSAQIAGEPIKVDILTANEYYALNLINIGMDGDTGFYKKKFQGLPGISGAMAYNLALVYCFFQRYGIMAEIEVDGKLVLSPKGYVLTAFGNGTTYGGGYRATPEAIIDDGIIDVCLCRLVSRLTILRYLPIFKKGLHVGHPGLEDIFYYGKHQRIRFKSDQELHICLDGEFFDAKEVKIGIEKSALNFSLPQGVKKKE